MQNETLYERIKRLSNVSIKQLELELGLKDGLIQKWKQSKPRIDNFSLVAKRFGVSMEFLWTGEENSTTALSTERQTTALSTELAELAQAKNFINTAKLYQRLTDMERGIAIDFIIDMLKHRGVDTHIIVGY